MLTKTAKVKRTNHLSLDIPLFVAEPTDFLKYDYSGNLGRVAFVERDFVEIGLMDYKKFELAFPSKIDMSLQRWLIYRKREAHDKGRFTLMCISAFKIVYVITYWNKYINWIQYI